MVYNTPSEKVSIPEIWYMFGALSARLAGTYD
jgi:hypothetical protein